MRSIPSQVQYSNTVHAEDLHVFITIKVGMLSILAAVGDRPFQLGVGKRRREHDPRNNSPSNHEMEIFWEGEALPNIRS